MNLSLQLLLSCPPFASVISGTDPTSDFLRVHEGTCDMFRAIPAFDSSDVMGHRAQDIRDAFGFHTVQSGDSEHLIANLLNKLACPCPSAVEVMSIGYCRGGLCHREYFRWRSTIGDFQRDIGQLGHDDDFHVHWR
jgi:hypothetical protein